MPPTAAPAYPAPPAGLVDRVNADPRDWDARSILADWYFDLGRDDLYEAWKWLNEEGRVPADRKGDRLGGWIELPEEEEWRDGDYSLDSCLPRSIVFAKSDDDVLLVAFSGSYPFHHLRRAAEVIAQDRPALPRGLPR